MVGRDESHIERFPVVDKHTQYFCKCGRKLAGCTCPEHQGDKVIRTSVCALCAPASRIKDILGIEEKG